MTRQHRLAHVWLWFVVTAIGGGAFVLWLTTQP